MLDRCGVVGLRELLAGNGDVVLGAIEEVGDLRFVALAVGGEHPVRVGAVAGVAGVGDDDDVALAERGSAVRGIDRGDQPPALPPTPMEKKRCCQVSGNSMATCANRPARLRHACHCALHRAICRHRTAGGGRCRLCHTDIGHVQGVQRIDCAGRRCKS